MKEYITTLIYVSVFSILLELIIPETKLKKYISTIISLVILILVVTPIVNVVKAENILEVLAGKVDEINFNITNSSKEYEVNLYNNVSISSSVKKRIEEDIYINCKKQEFNVVMVDVSLTDEYLITDVNIYVKDISNVDDARDIIRYVTDTYNLKKNYINIIKVE